MDSTIIKKDVRRIGLLLADLGKLNLAALKTFVLQLNSHQKSFEYEFLPCDDQDTFIQMLSSKEVLERSEIKNGIPAFLLRYNEYLTGQIVCYKLKEKPPPYFIIITMASFADEYYTTRKDGLSILALGNWERSMAPPSVLEFILTLALRESVAAVSSSLYGSIHLGTKGCLFDFTADLGDVRFKVFHGFICSYCRAALVKDGLPDLADELVYVLRKEWLGKSTDPSCPAGILYNLGYDLFSNKGLKATAWETFVSTLQQEGVKEFVKLVFLIVLAILTGALTLHGLDIWVPKK